MWSLEYRAAERARKKAGQGKAKGYKPQVVYQPQGHFALQDRELNWHYPNHCKGNWEVQASTTNTQWSQQAETAASASTALSSRRPMAPEWMLGGYESHRGTVRSVGM